MASGVDFLGEYTGAMGKVNAVYTGIKTTIELIKGTITFLGKITKHWRDIQQSAFETARAVGLNRQQAMAYDRVLMQSAKELGRQYGITYKNIAKWQEEYVTKTGKAIIMNREQQEAMAAMSRLAGEDVSAQMVDEMNRFGGSINEAEVSLALVQERAKALGLSTKTASEALAKNMHLASTYQFKNGIDGLQRMLLTSQRLRVNMESITNVADKFQSIEGSIEGASKLQVLGGTFAQQFSNPMGVLYESLNDVNGLAKRIENTVKGLATFDKKTGEVRISGLDQQRIKAAAEAMGMSRQELTQMAMSKAKEGEVQGVLNRNANIGKFNESQKALIQNKAVWDAEKQTFVINQMDEHGNEVGQLEVDKLTEDQVKLLQDSNLTEEKLWGDVHAIREALVGDFRNRARGTTSTNENLEGLSGEFDSFLAQLENIMMGYGGSWLFNGKSFQPWDTFKTLGTGTAYFANGGIVDSQKDTKPVKAEFGAMIPGNSYTGDKVPVMANSGEMILNKDQQSGLWDILKNLGKTAAMMYAGNKIGSKFGLSGVGTMIGLQSLMTKGEASVGQLAGTGMATGIGQLVVKRMFGNTANSMMPKAPNLAAPPTTGGGLFTKLPMMAMAASMMGMRSPMMAMAAPMMGMRSPMMAMAAPMMGMRSPMMPGIGMGANINLIHPNVFMNGNVTMDGNIMGGSIVDQMVDLGDATDLATKNTKNYGKAIKDFSSKWSGRFMKNTSLGRGINRQVIGRGRLMRGKTLSAINNARGRTLSVINNTKSWLNNTNLGQRYQYYKYQQALKPKTPSALSRWSSNIKNSEFVSDIRRVFRGGRSTSDVIKATERAANASKGVLNSTNVASKIGDNKAVSSLTKIASKLRGGKALSSLGNGAKLLGRAAGPVGAILGAASLVSDVSAANSQYREREREIENSNMSELEKARAKDDAVREKNASKGSSIGGVGGGLAGAAAGAAMGSVIPVVGTAIGGIVGGLIGSFGGSSIGKGIGGLFGGSNEKKLKEEKEKTEKKTLLVSSNNRGIEDISRTVDNIYSYMLSGKLSETHGVVSTSKISNTYMPKSINMLGGALSGAIGGLRSIVSNVSNIYAPKAGNLIGGALSGAIGGMKNAIVDMKTNQLTLPLLGHSLIGNAISGVFKGVVGFDEKQVNTNKGNKKIAAKPSKAISKKITVDKPLATASKKDKPLSPDSIIAKDNIVKPSKPIGEKTYVAPVKHEDVKAKEPVAPSVKDINLNVSGTIKLDGGNNTSSALNLDELLKDPTFIRKIKDMIVKNMSEVENGGKQNLEYDRSNRRR